MQFKPPTISLALTLHDRPESTIKRVGMALAENRVDQLILVLDRPTQEVRDSYHWFIDHTGYDFVKVELPGEGGWRCSAAAWNAAFSEVASELLVCISSDVVMEPGCTTRLAAHLAAYPAVIYGKVLDENPEVGDQLAKGLTRKVLCSSREPRPLGFIMGLPMWAVRATGGYDEGLMEGIWYEDGDWTQRLWAEGLPFVFDDAVRGVHISHPRPFLDEQDGVRKQHINMHYMIRKWGSLNPFSKNQANMQYVNSTENKEEGILYMLHTLDGKGRTIEGALEAKAVDSPAPDGR